MPPDLVFLEIAIMRNVGTKDLSVSNRLAGFHKRLETIVFDKSFWKRGQIMPKNHACEEKPSKCTKEQTLSSNCKFVWSSKIIKSRICCMATKF